MNNISLIGMPGAGKSTTGLILAKVIGYNFIDTDILIQKQENRLLQRIIEEDGMTRFLNIESKVITAYDYEKCVIATGGSAVLCENTMAYLSDKSTVIYLKLHLDRIIQRLGNISSRGIVMTDNQSLSDVYNLREPLYEKYADMVVDCNKCDIEEVVDNIVKMIHA